MLDFAFVPWAYSWLIVAGAKIGGWGNLEHFLFGHVQGHRKTFRSGAATSKKHAFGSEAAEKLISASHGWPIKAWLRIYVHGKYGGIDRAYPRKLHWSGFCTDTQCTQMCSIRLRGLGPRKIFWKFDAMRWLLRPFWSLKTSLGSLSFSLGVVTEFASLPHAWRLVSIGIGGFRYTHGTRLRSAAWKPVNNSLLLWILFWSTPVKNVWPSRSQSCCSQVSAVLFYARTTKFVRAQICVGDMRVSRLQGSATSKHWSADCRVCQTCSPSLSERNECVKETVLLIIQGLKLKFQKLTEKVGWPRLPQPPCFWWPWRSNCYAAQKSWKY